MGAADRETSTTLRGRARAALAGGRPGEARRLLDHAARLLDGPAEEADRASVLAAAAGAARQDGDLATCTSRAHRALTMAPRGSEARVAALHELGEVATAGGDRLVAVERFIEAVAEAERGGLPAGWRASLLRRLARAQVDALAYVEAALAAEAARDLLRPEGLAARPALEAAGAWALAGRRDDADRTWALALRHAEEQGDERVLAEALLLWSAWAAEAGDVEVARAAAHAAGLHAERAAEAALVEAARAASADLRR
jgi:hypothetical protein